MPPVPVLTHYGTAQAGVPQQTVSDMDALWSSSPYVAYMFDIEPRPKALRAQWREILAELEPRTPGVVAVTPAVTRVPNKLDPEREMQVTVRQPDNRTFVCRVGIPLLSWDLEKLSQELSSRAPASRPIRPPVVSAPLAVPIEEGTGELSPQSEKSLLEAVAAVLAATPTSGKPYEQLRLPMPLPKKPKKPPAVAAAEEPSRIEPDPDSIAGRLARVLQGHQAQLPRNIRPLLDEALRAPRRSRRPGSLFRHSYSARLERASVEPIQLRLRLRRCSPDRHQGG